MEYYEESSIDPRSVNFDPQLTQKWREAALRSVTIINKTQRDISSRDLDYKQTEVLHLLQPTTARSLLEHSNYFNTGFQSIPAIVP